MSVYHKQCLRLVLSLEYTRLVDRLRGDIPPRDFICRLIDKAASDAAISNNLIR